MEQYQEDSAPPAVFRPSSTVQIMWVMLGVVGIATGCLLQVTVSADSTPSLPVVVSIALGVLSLLIGLDYFLRPAPAVVVDDDGVELRPFGRIPWDAISRVHVIAARIDPSMRYLSIELVEPTPKLAGRRWIRWIHFPVNKLVTGHPASMPEHLLRPISLDDIAAEMDRRNPDLVIVRSVRRSLRRSEH